MAQVLQESVALWHKFVMTPDPISPTIWRRIADHRVKAIAELSSPPQRSLAAMLACHWLLQACNVGPFDLLLNHPPNTIAAILAPQQWSRALRNAEKERIMSLLAEKNALQFAVPGGLIGVGTKIDPKLTRADKLVGQVLGHPGKLPSISAQGPHRVPTGFPPTNGYVWWFLKP
eukprot:Skav208436  [mRNA]  locus=scaffold1952:101231:125645:- [translate_table: standard]